MNLSLYINTLILFHKTSKSHIRKFLKEHHGFHSPIFHWCFEMFLNQIIFQLFHFPSTQITFFSFERSHSNFILFFDMLFSIVDEVAFIFEFFPLTFFPSSNLCNRTLSICLLQFCKHGLIFFIDVPTTSLTIHVRNNIPFPLSEFVRSDVIILGIVRGSWRSFWLWFHHF